MDGMNEIVRKFYIFKPRTHPKPLVAALGYFNTKAFEDACKTKGIECAVVSEETATIALQRSNGIGVGCYTQESAIPAPTPLKRQIAAKNRMAVVDLTGVLVVEPPIELEPVRQLVYVY
jgi:hypothetical protein